MAWLRPHQSGCALDLGAAQVLFPDTCGCSTAIACFEAVYSVAQQLSHASLDLDAGSGICNTQDFIFTLFDSAAAVSVIYPFFSDSHAWLLLMVVFLGMFSGLAFGSSYQLVSKFPAKNSAALTLGAPCFGLPLPCQQGPCQTLCGAVGAPSLTKEAHRPAISPCHHALQMP